MRRKLMVGAVAVLLSAAMLSAPAVWASPAEASLGAADWWRTWLTELSLAITDYWRGLVDPSATNTGAVDEVDPAVLLDGGETCTDPTITKHGCGVDPDG